ncbi:hypothetical protein SLEP1_g1632 [Rubroshorea leprosula]|uniref:Uncharacterized protein n=1 Tax=Rubroshorea leprosula TaxID=152421 RepID=A0AAV5HPU0_9ROSI|nr:hypothetical protein SLEP1_g1632 [Rubroshorea leprosula]
MLPSHKWRKITSQERNSDGLVVKKFLHVKCRST